MSLADSRVSTENSSVRPSGHIIRSALLPLSIIAAVATLLAPLPTFVMDYLLSLNLALSVLMLSTVLFIKTPIEFSVFPTVLLATTLYRLVLNIATTRLILTNAPQDGPLAAGQVINAFSNFVTGNNLIVGVVIFMILVLIQFLVITKGASRISEVAARFTLDSLPGKQSAIDADLNAGIISSQEAQNRRQDLVRQSDFFGAMDGASKFVRGDAIAGLCITGVNIIGGLAIGISSGMAPAKAVDVFTRLTIGDGLVGQLPALLISLAAAMLMTRSSEKTELPEQVSQQIFSHSGALFTTGLFLLLLTLTNLPTVPLLCLGIGCIGLAWIVHKNEEQSQRQTSDSKLQQQKTAQESSAENLLTVDPLEIQLGRNLASLGADELLPLIRNLRRQFAKQWGILLPKISITDSNPELDDNSYQVNLFGLPLAVNMLRPQMIFAVDTGSGYDKLNGLFTLEAETKNPGYWISVDKIESARDCGYEIRRPVEVIANHLEALCRLHAAELLTRDSTKALIDQLRKTSPAVVDELIPEQMKLSAVQQVLQRLLQQHISIRQLEQILEALGDQPHLNIIAQVEYVRGKMGRAICAPLADLDGHLKAIMLSPELQTTIRDNCRITDSEIEIGLSPTLQAQLNQKIAIEIEQFHTDSFKPILLTSPEIRPLVEELFHGSFPGLTIVGTQEVPLSMTVESAGVIS